MKFDRRKTARRRNSLEVEPIYNNNGYDCRRRNRRLQQLNPISTWFLVNKTELKFYFFVFIICSLISTIYFLKSNSTSKNYILEPLVTTYKLNQDVGSNQRQMESEENRMKVRRNPETGKYYLK